MNLVQFPGLGLSFELNRVAFSIGGFSIYWYGVCIAVGLCLALVFAFRHSIEFGVDPDGMVDVILIGIVLGIVSARAYYVAMAPFKYESIWEMIAIRDGGLAIYGGVIAVVIVAIILCRSRHIKLGAMMDLVVMGLLIGQAIGRWGNFLNREAFGAETTLPWRMQLTTTAGELVEVHPTFLYESLWNLIGLLLIVFVVSKARRFDGENTCFYFLWYGVGRFWIEGLRTDSLYLFNWTIAGQPIRVSQVLSLVLMIAALAVLFYNIKLHPHQPEDLYVNQVAAREAAAAAAAEAPAETEAAGSRDDAPESAQAEPLDDEPAAPKDEIGGE